MHHSHRRFPNRDIVLAVDPDTAQAFCNYFGPRYHHNADIFYAIHVAPTGQAALKLCTLDQVVDLTVVLDTRLADMTCEEFLVKLNTTSHDGWDPFFAKIIDYIFLEDRPGQSDKVLPAFVRNVWHIAKPLNFSGMEQTVRWLGHGRLPDDCNPITRLPAGRLIEKCLRTLLGEQDWALLYMGIDGFESFEDSNDWESNWKTSKQVQRFLADLIEEAVDEHSAPTDFIGHIYGEDFVTIISQPEKAEIIARQLQLRFAGEVQQCYPTGTAVPPLKLIVGILQSSDGPFADIREITERSAAARQQQKTDID